MQIPAEELHICVPPHLLRYVMPGPEGVDDDDDPTKSALLQHLRPSARYGCFCTMHMLLSIVRVSVHDMTRTCDTLPPTPPTGKRPPHPSVVHAQPCT